MASKYDVELVPGKKKGSWTVLEGPVRDKGRTRVKCVCVCGTEADVLAYNLANKKTTQCRKCSSGKTPTATGLFNLTKRSARSLRSAISYELTPENVSETLALQGYSCGLTQEPLTMESSSMVRLDHSQGYNPENVMVVSTTAKQAMGEMDVTSFVNFAHQITANVKKNPPKTTAEFFSKRENE